MVASVSPEGVTVCYVDYSNSETVDPSQVFVLQPNFLSTPVQAIECSLSNVPDSPAHEETVSNFSALVTDKELLVTFKNQLGPNQWEVALQESGEVIGSALFPVTSVTEKLSEMTIRSVSVPPSNVKVGETYPVYVAFADSPSKFFSQLVSENDKLEALMAEVDDFYSGNQLEVELTAVTYCVAQYSGSWSWYRAQITAVHSEEDIVVYFLDYGDSVNSVYLMYLTSSIPTSPHLTGGRLYRTCHKNSVLHTAMQAASILTQCYTFQDLAHEDQQHSPSNPLHPVHPHPIQCAGLSTV